VVKPSMLFNDVVKSQSQTVRVLTVTDSRDSVKNPNLPSIQFFIFCCSDQMQLILFTKEFKQYDSVTCNLSL